MGAWIGAAIAMLVLSFLKGQVADGNELAAVNYCIRIIDTWVIIPAALLTLATGIGLCWLTAWGFSKFLWIIVKLVLTVAQILFGTFFLGRWTEIAASIAQSDRLTALTNPEYLASLHLAQAWGLVQLAVLLALVYVSTVKPWGKRKSPSNS